MTSREVPLSRPLPREEKMMHPCEFIQRSAAQQEEALRLNRIRTTHGIGAAAAVALDEVTLLSGRRIGSLPASNTLYHAYRGNFVDFSPSDIYGLPQDDPNVQPSSRALMERAVYGHELTMKNLGM